MFAVCRPIKVDHWINEVCRDSDWPSWQCWEAMEMKQHTSVVESSVIAMLCLWVEKRKDRNKASLLPRCSFKRGTPKYSKRKPERHHVLSLWSINSGAKLLEQAFKSTLQDE